MSTPSLGMLLQAQTCATEECVQALERRAAMQGACAQADLELVRRFFHQASIDFAGAIQAGLAPPVLVIGNGQNDKLAAILQTYRWNGEYDVGAAEHPYNGAWQPFRNWCEANELQPELVCHRQSGGAQKWVTLAVRPGGRLA